MNDALVARGPRRRRTPDYPRLHALRRLVYAKPVGIEMDKRLIRHLTKHRRGVRGLRLRQVPRRTTVSRW